MENYNVIKKIGSGSFGRVWLATNKQTGEAVAIKEIKKRYHSMEECLNLGELKSLKKLNHPNIIKLKEVIKVLDVLCLVFEYMECNLLQLMETKGRPFSEEEVRKWCFEILKGLVHMHRRGFFHRDLKPENLLLKKDVIKIADLGMAMEIDSKQPYTHSVGTLWYRAPEVLLRSPCYGPAVDMWAIGAIMFEMLTLTPLFPGLSEGDQIHKICSVIGSPKDENVWAEGIELARVSNYEFPQVDHGKHHLSDLMPFASQDAIDLIILLCSWDPRKRPTASEALRHPFFRSCFYVPPSLRPRAAPASARVRRKVELTQQAKYRPPFKNGKTIEGYVFDVGEKLGNMTLGSGKVPVAGKQKQQYPAMKAGGWQGNSDFSPEKSFIRKVAG